MNAASARLRPALKMLLCAALMTAAGARADAPAPQWGYTGDTGPAHWAAEDPAFATCGIGKRQSPIDIRDARSKALPPIEFAYQPLPLVVTDNGYTLQVNAPAGSGGITVGADHYDLVQFHFHRPSEESVRGKRYSLVAHLVHRNAKGELAVVAVLIGTGKENAFLKSVFDNFPPRGQAEKALAGEALKLSELLPKQQGYYTFEGSLTIPPCSEQVRWFVLKRPVQASSGQVAQFAARYPHNARPLQPRNGRTIEQTLN